MGDPASFIQASEQDHHLGKMALHLFAQPEPQLSLPSCTAPDVLLSEEHARSGVQGQGTHGLARQALGGGKGARVRGPGLLAWSPQQLSKMMTTVVPAGALRAFST